MLLPRFESHWEMLLTYARAFAVTVASVEFARGQLNTLTVLAPNEAIQKDGNVALSIKSGLQLLRDLCQSIPSLNLLCHAVDRAESNLDAGAKPIQLTVELQALQNQLMDQLRNHYYFPVDGQAAAAYDNEAPFGLPTYEAFPSARLDIRNATKCIIFGQATASVFHLMRVMEVALKVLGRKLQIAYAPSWEAYLSQIQQKVAEKHVSKSASWKRQQPLFLDFSGDLMTIKMAWRNPTMHIVREYDTPEAHTILMAVATFMNRMAEAGYKETGKPVAVRVALAGQP